jgi:hypothetical protein
LRNEAETIRLFFFELMSAPDTATHFFKPHAEARRRFVEGHSRNHKHGVGQPRYQRRAFVSRTYRRKHAHAIHARVAREFRVSLLDCGELCRVECFEACGNRLVWSGRT